MKMERRSIMMNGNGDSHFFTDNFLVSRSNGGGGCYAMIPVVSSSSSSSPLNNNYIVHKVSKMDTLAGVAIKYGVEVSDIRRVNGLVTDLQMFAHKSLQIPLPGRHPPSPILSCNGSASINGEQTPPRGPHDDILDSLQSLKLKPPRRVSPAMSTLQGYYGLPTVKRGLANEGTEMAVYNPGKALCFEEGLLSRKSAGSDSSFSRHRKSRSLMSLENGDMSTEEKAFAEAGDSSEVDRSIRRRPKSEVDTILWTPEILMKEDSSGGSSGRTGKGLALRPKLGSRIDNPIFSVTDSYIADVFVSVRKSSSTSNLQDDVESAPSIWPTGKWSDAIGLPNPITGRRNKAALD